jgi:hypothetical protein
LKRKNLLICIITLTAILATSSVIAVSQALWPAVTKPEYVLYDFKATFTPAVEITKNDASGFPIVIVEGNRLIEGIIECTVRIGDKVYSYPDDFRYQETFHSEVNAITGSGFDRVASTFIFNLPGHPTLTDWLVAHVTGMGQPPTPFANAEFEGTIGLTGTATLEKVGGFGLEEAYALPPDGANIYVHHVGLIKGWPF